MLISPRRCLLVITLAVTAATLTYATANAGDPSPANWTTPALIPVMGQNAAGVPDPRSEVVITARDLANAPMPGVMVVIDFSACTELHLCSNPQDPDEVVDCANHRVWKFTDANGVVRFRITGCSTAVPGSAGAPYNCGKIYGDGVLEASPSVAIYDLTGCNGLTASDLSAWLADFFTGLNPARADYDATGGLGSNDLSFWLTAYFASGSAANCASGGPCAP